MDPAAHNILHEETHWLLLILGHLLADDNHGEAAVIPAALMQCACVDDGAPCLPLEVCNLAFHLLELESGQLLQGDAAMLSPQVAATSMWFVRRWCGPYLLLDESKCVVRTHRLSSSCHSQHRANMRLGGCGIVGRGLGVGVGEDG